MADETTGTYGDFTYTISNGEVTITGYNGLGGEVIIPSEINGVNVTGIGDRALCVFNSPSKVIIPDTVTSIGNEAFCSCRYLTEITIPENVSDIGYNAFSSCTNLQIIYFDAISCNVFDSSPFSWCPNLTTVIFGNNVKIIPNNVFAFCDTLTDVSLSQNVNIIGENAFYECTSITEVTIPENVTNIGLFAFGLCTNLKTVKYNAINCNTTYESSPFVHCASLSNIYIGNLVESIPTYTFSYLENLINVKISNSVMNIGKCAFLGCSSCIIYSTVDAYAHQYAIENNIKWVDISTYRVGNAEIVKVIKNDDLLMITMDLKTESTHEIGTLFVSVYSDNGVLIKMLPIQTILPEKTEYAFDITEINSDCKMKVFAWRDLSSLTPLCEAREYSLKLVDVPDILLKQHINSTLSAGRNPNSTITKSDMESLKNLTVDDKITNLDGLQYAKNLENLYLMDTELTEVPEDIFVGMSNLKQLALWSSKAEFENSLPAVQKLQSVNKNVSVCLDRDLMDIMILPQHWDVNGLSLSCPEKYVLWDLDNAIEQAEGNWGLTESQIAEVRNLNFTSVKIVDYWEENYKNVIQQDPNASVRNPADLYTIEPSLENNFDFTNGPIQFRIRLKRNPNIYIDITRGFTKYPLNNMAQ